jgi:hypothetical protein
MNSLLDRPLLVFAVSFLALWLSTWIGTTYIRRNANLPQGTCEDIGTILAATLTLNALIIGFTFSMAAGRYEQRKTYEEAEANAIGTEYLRADLLPAAEAAKVRSLLRKYLEQRVLFYITRAEKPQQDIGTYTTQLQTQLWDAVRGVAQSQPTPVVALAVAGMNDVLNSQGYTQASWWNRIPSAAWLLMASIAVIGNLLVGYDAVKSRTPRTLLMVVPCILSISFLLIADLDSPRGGIIRVSPRNLASLVDSIRDH